MEETLLEVKKYWYRKTIGIKNKIRYGFDCPDFGELIFIDPREVDTYLISNNLRAKSGLVVKGNWDLKPQVPLQNIPRFKFCKMHWQDNKPWSETGIYDYMLSEIERKGSVDGCYNWEDIIFRYQKLDEIFENVKATQTLKTRRELDPQSFNESGGILFHIDRNNKPIYGGGGVHRFSMAKILELKEIPAQLGLLHPKAIKEWKIHKKRFKER